MRYFIFLFLFSISVQGQIIANRDHLFGSATAIETSAPDWYVDVHKEYPTVSDGTDVTGLTDYGSAGIDFITNGTDNGVINVASDGIRELEFTGDDWYTPSTSNPSELEVDPDADDFTCMVVLGELGTTGTSNYILQKGSLGSSVTQTVYGFRFTSSSTVRGNTGGVQSGTESLPNSGANTAYVIFLTNQNSGVNGEQFIDGTAGNTWNPGTYTSTNNLRLGQQSRLDDDTSSNGAFVGSMRAAAFWNRILTSQEITDISDQYQVD